MPKHAVPKKKTAKPDSKRRYNVFKGKAQKRLANDAALVDCGNCGSKKLNHHVCNDCGQYNGKQVFDKEKAISKAVTKIKA